MITYKSRLGVGLAMMALSVASHAQSSDVAALEARVAELEAMIKQLVGKESEAKSAPAAKPMPMKTPDNGVSGETHTYKFGGYLRLDAKFSDYSAGDLAPGSAGTQFYIPATIPVGTGEGEGPDLNVDAKASRINFKSDHVLNSGDKVSTFLELDFYLSPGGNERVSNSYNPRLRHAFVKYNDWLFGQTWSTFQDVSALPETFDFIGVPEGTTFGRQAMVRYTQGNWEFAVENPETTITPNGGGARIVSDDGSLPDFIARYTHRLNNGYIKVAGLARQLYYDIDGQSDGESSLSLSVSGKHAIGDNGDDIRWMVTTGSGVGRYLGLNTGNGAVIDSDGNLEAIDQTGWFLAYRHVWNDKWRSSFMYSSLAIDNETDLTGTGVTKDVYSAHINLLYAPIPKLTLGGELMFAEREIESGLDGNLTRFILSAKYAF
ncbi:MAG: DcaP family trimeric outer membrane transporter [Woeseiaceae bacterium]|nr:DcaP family trimeric outer membrane transporter [Woeseiaceae bacterium]